MRAKILIWLEAWGRHNLEGVMELMHEQVVFDNWTGETISGKSALCRAWAPWFMRHGNFQFVFEDLFIDEAEQKALFQWQLLWPSLEKSHKGNPEIRRGVDVLHFFDGKIIKKYSYSKTTLSIDGQAIVLSAAP
ncbi:MAG TPA: nuclear transport factor 2 family protein [Cellvibrio sp.]|nr:nuclear transport factor 2 family protein [Cellvibrio sp.]